MTGPAEKPHAGAKHVGGFVQLVRWLNEERSASGSDDVGFVAGAPWRTARWTYGDPPVPPRRPEAERDVLGEVRIGPAPRCAVAGETIALSVSLVSARGGMYLGWPIKLEWSSSDPSIATVSDGGIVEVKAKGRVELTCRCEDKSASVLLTVVEPAVAAAVGLPVPERLLAASRRAAAERRAAARFIVPEPVQEEPSDVPAAPPAAVPAPLPSVTPSEPSAPPSAALTAAPESLPETRPEALPEAILVHAPPAGAPPTGRRFGRRAERRVEHGAALAALPATLPVKLPDSLPAEVRAELPAELLRELEPIYRRSIERSNS